MESLRRRCKLKLGFSRCDCVWKSFSKRMTAIERKMLLLDCRGPDWIDCCIGAAYIYMQSMECFVRECKLYFGFSRCYYVLTR